jgi:hypothetical protein
MIFKTRWFERFARKEKIGDPVLVDAVARPEKVSWMPILAAASLSKHH